MAFRTDINALRAIAVILVILYHFSVPGFSGGFVGVDVFFVISGFLMTKIILRGIELKSFSLSKFITDRFKRIFPALLFLCVTILVFGWLFLSPLSYAVLAKSSLTSLLFLSNVYFWRTSGYFDLESHSNLLLHTWSLSIEWQFYLIFPILIVVAKRISTRPTLINILLITSFLFSFALSAYFAFLRPSPAFYLLPTRAWEMLAGSFVYLVVTRWDFKIPGLAAVFAMVLLIGCSFFYFGQMAYPGINAAVPVAAAVIFLLARPGGVLIDNSFMQKVGDWSYSLYLWHWPAAVLYAKYVSEVGVLVAGTLAGIGVLLFSYFSYTYIEQLRFADKKTILRLFFGGAIAVIGAAVIVLNNGFYGRGFGTEEDLKHFEAAFTDWDFPSECNGVGLTGEIKPCLVNSEASSDRVLFVGDSHVQQFWPRLKTRKDWEHSIAFVTSGGCPPLPDVSRTANGFNCPIFWKFAFDMAKEDKTKRVIFGSLWLDYFSFGNAEKPRLSLCRTEDAQCRSSASLSKSDELEIFSLFKNRLAELKSLGKEIVILLPILSSTENKPRLRYEDLFFGRDTVEMIVPLDNFNGRAHMITKILREIAAELNLVIVDPNEFLCDGGTCSYFDDQGKLRYMDGNHLRASYVKRWASFLDSLVVMELK